MSHTHSHTPGQPCGHNHGPQPQQPQMAMRPPDPVMQALIEASFRPVDIALAEPGNASALCGAHSLEKCAECGADYVNLNRLSRILAGTPNLRCPPPPQVVNQKLSQAINNVKEEGNAHFKTGSHEAAIQRYSMAAGRRQREKVRIRLVPGWNVIGTPHIQVERKGIASLDVDGIQARNEFGHGAVIKANSDIDENDDPKAWMKHNPMPMLLP